MSVDQTLVIPETLLIQLPNGQTRELPLEEYLKGVIPSEMGLQKLPEALKAQAIASRGFAVSTRRHARDGFDMCTTRHCQLWQPVRRDPDADRAVDQTTGQVAVHAGRIVATPFFGHCDGRTRSSEEVWSGAIQYCRSVPCDCGHTRLHGHGVGMCQSGAIAMALAGATAGEILRHYYTGIKVIQAGSVPRTSFRRSMILGQIVDRQNSPRPGLRLELQGPEGSQERETDPNGHFWYTKLPAGRWELVVQGEPVRRSGLVTDGRNTLEIRVVVPLAPHLEVQTVPLGGPRQLVGTLGYDGVTVTINAPDGGKSEVISGSAAQYNPGGFVVPLSSSGVHKMTFLDQSLDLEIGDAGLWVRITPASE